MVLACYLHNLGSISFVASWARSLVDLPHSFPSLESLINGVLCPKNVTVGGSITHELQLSLPENKALEDLLINPKKLQHKLSQEYFKQMVSSIQENCQSCHEASRFRSLQGKGAWALAGFYYNFNQVCAACCRLLSCNLLEVGV